MDSSLEIRKEALLNEYKGNVFEFLVALEIAREKELEKDFYSSLSEPMKEMLKQQEGFIRNYYPSLLERLPVLARSLAGSIMKKVEMEKLKGIRLIGKIQAREKGKEFSEADILLLDSEDRVTPISIKLNKHKAMTNTKSAGVKSFLSKYFANMDEKQSEINREIELLFKSFIYDIHMENDVEVDENFNHWVVAGLPQLPGQLEGRSRELYLDLLYGVTGLYYTALNEIERGEESLRSFSSLIGYSDENIIQAACFYKKDYEYATDYVYSLKDSEVLDFTFLPYTGETSYFEIQFSKLVLQIRIKAMNKFINKSFKVNCSVRYL